MKKRNNLLFAGLMTCMLIGGFTSCEKEITNKPTVATQRDPARLPVADGTISVGSSCGETTSCGPNYASIYKYNSITFTKDALTISVFPSLRYSIYKHTSGPLSGVSTYTKIAEFTCDSDIVKFASSSLDNATSHFLLLSVPGTPVPLTSLTATAGVFSIVPAFAFTTGNFKGTLCVIKS